MHDRTRALAVYKQASRLRPPGAVGAKLRERLNRLEAPANSQ